MYITSRHIDTRTGAISTGNGETIAVYVRSGVQGPPGPPGTAAPFNAISPEGSVQGTVVGGAIILDFSNWNGIVRNMPIYADNEAALLAGAEVDQWYKTPAGDIKTVIEI